MTAVVQCSHGELPLAPCFYFTFIAGEGTKQSVGEAERFEQNRTLVEISHLWYLNWLGTKYSTKPDNYALFQ